MVLICCYKDKVSWGISTNGSLLTPQRLKFLYDNHVKILFSIDGPKEIQNDQRKTIDNQNSFELIESFIPIISEFFPSTVFRSTCTPLHPEGLYEGYKFAKQNNFQCYYNCLEEFSDKNWTEDKKAILIEQFQEIEKEYINSLNQNSLPLLFLPFQEFLGISLNSRLEYDCENCIRCGVGTLSLGFDIYGNIYTCNEQATYSTDNPFCIGNIFDGINNYKIQNLHNQVKNIQCKHPCKNEIFCKQLCCLSRRYFMFKDFNKSSNIWCFWLKSLSNMQNDLLNIFGEQKIKNLILQAEEVYRS